MDRKATEHETSVFLLPLLLVLLAAAVEGDEDVDATVAVQVGVIIE